MALTEQQRADRVKGIGGSDVAAIFGEDPFRSAQDVWLEKTAKMDQSPESDAMRPGRYFEPGLIDYAAEEMGIAPEALRRNVTRVADDGVNRVNADSLIEGYPWGIEAKVVSRFNKSLPSWDKHEGEVPAHVLLQCHQLMLVCSLELVLVPALLAGDLQLFKVHRDDDLIQAVQNVNLAFWRDYVETRTPPPGTNPAAIETLKRIVRVPNKTVQVPMEVAQGYLSASLAAKEAKEESEAAQARLLMAMGDAEAAVWERGSFSYNQQSRDGYTVKPTTFRVLRHKEKKNQLQEA